MVLQREQRDKISHVHTKRHKPFCSRGFLGSSLFIIPGLAGFGRKRSGSIGIPLGRLVFMS